MNPLRPPRAFYPDRDCLKWNEAFHPSFLFAFFDRDEKSLSFLTMEYEHWTVGTSLCLNHIYEKKNKQKLWKKILEI